MEIESKEQKEEKIERKHLTNEEVEKVEWELISISIYPNQRVNTVGTVELRFAYKDDIDDTYIKDRNGNFVFRKIYPNFIKRQIISKIKETIGDKKVKVVNKREINKPTPITIKRNK